MKVYLIGTGPGDPGLITLKAARIIPTCDAVVYDDLIPIEILGLARPGVRKIYVGKRAGRDYMKQPEINELIAGLAREGMKVARLKGGDPCIFGRGGEEALYLKRSGIPFEIIPGITSAIAGPVSAGIPPTHRGMAASVRFVTAHEDPTKAAGFLDWSALARDTGTLVFLMGANRIKSIAERLMEEGMRPDMPCALVQNATLPTQRQIFSTLERVGEEAAAQGIGSPCIVVVGEVASLGRELFSEEDRPLKGRSVLITRPAHLAGESAALFAEAGAVVGVYPLLEISPLPFDLPDLSSTDILIFTSQNAVPLFFDKLLSSGLDARALAGKEIFCIGPKTRDTLLKYGIASDGMASEFRAEGIMDMLRDRELSGRKVCLPRAKGARTYLADALRERGAVVEEIFVYATVLPGDANREDFLDALSKADTAVFTSPSGVRHALELLNGERGHLENKTLVAIGPVTAAAMEKAGIPACLTAEEYTDAGIIEALKGE
ncbi:MAG TPA: uroporphyrinogen-III C-methyltransferase [Deltaproteobacteria bacterium]|jgi:uroporphyrinogen III methyltransferase/synthase|nr:uroporphyrinogen-III C-methyltransferase [Deltaproteobacteria bacterium]HOI07266.1 uroporphyrinogen-III C-methyltransferase [Deltaproteobacteria bacterium]